MQTMQSDRLVRCHGCGVFATDAAALQLGWQGSPTVPASIRCHTCISIAGAGMVDRSPSSRP